MIQMNSFTEQKESHRHRNKLMVTGRAGRERDRLGVKKKKMKEKWSAPPPPCQVLDGGLCVQIWGCYKTQHPPVPQGDPHDRTRERRDTSHRDQTLNTDRNEIGFLLSA